MPEAKTPLIHKLIAEVMSGITAIGKNQKNTQQNFKYRGIDDVYNELHALMAKAQVFTTSEVLDRQSEERPSKSGGILFYEKYLIRYTFNAPDGSSVTSEIVGIGMDSGDKAGNKAQAIAHKYALLQIFCVPTAEPKDPDGDSPQPREKPKVEPKQKPKKNLTRPQLFSMSFDEIAGNHGVDKKDYKDCKLSFLMEFYGREDIKSSKDISDSEWQDLAVAVKENKNLILNFVKAWRKNAG